MDSKKINKKFKICIIGSGYVGLVSGACLAEIGHEVICVDNDEKKIQKLKSGISPIYEPGLTKIIISNKKSGRLSFTTEVGLAVKKSDVIFIAVHTPTKDDGFTDLQFVEAVSEQVAKAMDNYKIIVSKSTMPVKTGQKIKEIINKFCKKGINFDVVSNPEFLREGSAVADFLKPDRIVIGAETAKARKIMEQIYSPIKSPIIFTNIESAEIIKHACNAYLATKISFINAIANICENNKADIDEVVRAMGPDKRIGDSFLKAGIGFGGSCFPKDVSAFIRVAKESCYDFSLLREVEKINQGQKDNFVDKIRNGVHGVKNKKLGILGLSFKPNTDDMRSAPSIYIINRLLEEGAIIKAFDPAAEENAKGIFHDKISYCPGIFETAEGCDALVILTEWDIFKNMDLKKVKSLLKNPIIIDGRNIFNPEKMRKLGFSYISIGRK